MIIVIVLDQFSSCFSDYCAVVILLYSYCLLCFSEPLLIREAYDF